MRKQSAQVAPARSLARLEKAPSVEMTQLLATGVRAVRYFGGPYSYAYPLGSFPETNRVLYFNM